MTTRVTLRQIQSRTKIYISNSIQIEWRTEQFTTDSYSGLLLFDHGPKYIAIVGKYVKHHLR